MVQSDGQEANSNISLVGNDVQQSHAGVRIFGEPRMGITVGSNRTQRIAVPTKIRIQGVNLIPYTAGAVGYGGR